MHVLTPRSLQMHTPAQSRFHLSHSHLNQQSQSQLMHTSMLSCSVLTSEADLSRLARSTACSPAPSARPLRAATVAEDLPVEGPVLRRQGSRPALHGGLAGAGACRAAGQFNLTTELNDGELLLAGLASPLLSPICNSRLSPPSSAANSMQFLCSEPLSTSMTQHHSGLAVPSLPSRPATALRVSSPSAVTAQRSRNNTPTPLGGTELQARHLPVPVAVEGPAIRTESGGIVSRGVTPIRELLGPMLAEPVAVGVGSCSVTRCCATPASDLGLGPALGSGSSPRQRSRAATFLPRQDLVGTTSEWDAKADMGNITTVAVEGLNRQPITSSLPQVLPLPEAVATPLMGPQPPCLAGVATPPRVPCPRLAVPVAKSAPLPALSQTPITMVTGEVRQQPTGPLHSVPTETNRCTENSAAGLPHFPVPTLVHRSRPNSPQVGNERSTAPPVTHKVVVAVGDASIIRLPLDEEALEVEEAAEVSNMDISADMPSPKSLVCPALQVSLGDAISPRTPQWPLAGGDTTTTGASTPTTSGSSGVTCAGFIDGVTDIEAKCRLARDPCDRPTGLPWASSRRPASPQMAARPWPTATQTVQAMAMLQDPNPISFAPDTAAIESSAPQLGRSSEATRDVAKQHSKGQREISSDAALTRTLARLNGQLQLLEGLVGHCEKCGGNDYQVQDQ